MIEAIIVKYLKEKLNIKVATEIPSNPPSEFLVVMATNGRAVAPNIEACMISVQAYSNTMKNASELNERVKDVMELLPELNDVTHSRLNSSGNNTDTERKRYRYQSVFDITYYRRSN